MVRDTLLFVGREKGCGQRVAGWTGRGGESADGFYVPDRVLALQEDCNIVDHIDDFKLGDFKCGITGELELAGF